MTRVGIGYDSHRFVPGDGVLLGGVRIPAGVALDGHSDADAVCHAVTDALLGAAAMGDIGTMFPDSDPANRGRSSVEMLRLAARVLAEAGWTVGNVDVTVISEIPKIAPARDEIRRNLAAAMSIAADAVFVKGKTNERMGWIGRSEGLAVVATVLVARQGG